MEQVMPLGREPALLRTDTPARLRARAARIRQFVRGFDDLTIARMKTFALDLEDRAAALEQTEHLYCNATVQPRPSMRRPPAVSK